MQIALSLIKQFLQTDLSPEEIAEHLTSFGLEVEKIVYQNLPYSSVLVASVERVEKHPEANRLIVAQVFDGTKKRQIVCGDTSLKSKEKVALVPEGSFYIDKEGKKTSFSSQKIRGELSEGMLVSEKELFISDNHEQVMRIDFSIDLGKDLSAILNDVIFDISLTPNLGHCQSALGVARELAISLQCDWSLPNIAFSEKEAKTEDEITIDIATEKCSEYGARIVDSVKVGPSSLPMRRILSLCGIRPINAVVDILHYVLLLYGQPMHAFDFDTLQGSSISVTASSVDNFLCLDKEKRSVKDAIFINDAKEPIAIGGIIGGLHSSVTEKTKKILIEAAHFDMHAIRKAAKQLQLKTESSQRFDKGVDQALIPIALNHACSLLQKMLGGEVYKGLVTTKIKEPEKTTISLQEQKVTSLVGIKISQSEIENILHRLHFSFSKSKNNSLKVDIPSYRFDIRSPIELIEEIAKCYGFNNISSTKPLFRLSNYNHSPLFLLQKKVKEILVEQGLYEVITSDLVNCFLANLLQSPSKEKIVTTLYSKSEEHSFLRFSLLPSHLQAMQNNLHQKTKDLSIFEISNIHFQQEGKFIEQNMLGILLTGSLQEPHCTTNATSFDFFDLKGIIENLFDVLHIESDMELSSNSSFHPFQQMQLSYNDKIIGTFGQVHPKVLQKMDIKQAVYYAEIDLSHLLTIPRKKREMKELSLYPGSERDVTIALDKKHPIGDILKQIDQHSFPFLEKVVVHDLYQDPSVKDNKTNITLRFYYLDRNKTLSTQEVEETHDKIVKFLLAKS